MSASGPSLSLSDLPKRVVVDQEGNYWRDFGPYYSMCPTTSGNEPLTVCASYVLDKTTDLESRNPLDPEKVAALTQAVQEARVSSAVSWRRMNG